LTLTLLLALPLHSGAGDVLDNALAGLLNAISTTEGLVGAEYLTAAFYRTQIEEAIIAGDLCSACNNFRTAFSHGNYDLDSHPSALAWNFNTDFATINWYHVQQAFAVSSEDGLGLFSTFTGGEDPST